jgi:hypothetical protein
MKLSERKLKRIIREETQNVLQEADFSRALGSDTVEVGARELEELSDRLSGRIDKSTLDQILMMWVGDTMRGDYR